MATVYVTNYAGHDYTDGENWGTLKPVTTGYVSFGSLDRLKFEVANSIRDSSPDDWLLMSGSPAVAAIVAVAWMMKHKRVNMLVHDNKNFGKYRELILTEKNFNDIFRAIDDAPRSDPQDVRVQQG